MDEFLKKMFFDNNAGDLLMVAAIILLVFIIKRFLSRYVAGLFFRVISLFTRNVERKEFVNLVVVPLENFLFILTVIIALDRLVFPAVWKFNIYHATSRNLVDGIGRAILVITFTWFLLKIIDFIAEVLKKKAALTPDATDDQLIIFFKDFFKAVLVIIGALMFLRFVFHYDVSTLITGLGIVTAAIALATKESLENLIASFIIFFNKPFGIGDVVKVQNVIGSIERIGLRSTRVRTEQKTFVTVPNKLMVDGIVDNLTLRTHRRGDILLELGADTGHAKLKSFIEKIKAILDAKGIANFSVYLSDINKNASVIKIEYLTMPVSLDDFNQQKQEISLGVIELMEQEEIKLATTGTQVIIGSS